MPHVRRTSPRISYGRRMRPTVRERHHRVFLFWIKVGRLDDHCIHRKAVPSFDLQEFRSAKLVVFQGRRFVFVNHANKFSIRAVEASLSRRIHIAPDIDEMSKGRTEVCPVRAFGSCKLSQTSAIELYAIKLRRDVAVFGRRKVNETICFVDTFERTHFPITSRQLANQLAISAVVIEMSPTAPLALPNERAVLQPRWMSNHSDPRSTRIVDEVVGLSISRIRDIEIEKGLLAVLSLEDNLLAVA